MKFHNQTQHGRRYEISSRFGKNEEKASKVKPKLKFKSKVENEEEITPEEIIPNVEENVETQETENSKILKSFKFLQNKDKSEDESIKDESEDDSEKEESKGSSLFIKKKKSGSLLKFRTDKKDDSDEDSVEEKFEE